MDPYEEFVAGLRRDINCLGDRDRMTRKNGLTRLERALKKEKRTDLVAKLFAGELHKPLLACFGDPLEKCRELALGILEIMFHPCYCRVIHANV